LVVIEDAAKRTEPSTRAGGTGGMGDLGCFSFYPGKNLGALWRGRRVVTNNPERANTIRMLRDWGQSRKYYHDLRGFNYRMEGYRGPFCG